MTTIEYACIVEGGTIIAQYPPIDQHKALGIGGFPTLVRRIVANTSALASGQRKTFSEKERNVHVKVSDLRVFVCVVPASTESSIAYGLLDYIEKEANTTPSTQWNQMIAERIRFISDPKNAKLSGLRIEVNETRDVLLDAVDSVLERGEKMTTLLDTTEELAREADAFHSDAIRLRRTMWVRKMKMIAIGVGVGVLLLILLILVVCKPNFSSCS